MTETDIDALGPIDYLVIEFPADRPPDGSALPASVSKAPYTPLSACRGAVGSQQWRGDSPLRPQLSPGEYAVVVVADNDQEDRVQPSPPMPASVVRRRSVSVAVHPGGERIALQASAISTT